MFRRITRAYAAIVSYGNNEESPNENDANNLNEIENHSVVENENENVTDHPGEIEIEENEHTLQNNLEELATSVLQENILLPATTQAGQRRVRMKWTIDVNKFIMRTYYTITELETNRTGYRQLLHRIFIEKFPGVPVTEQRLSDQVRAILRRRLLSDVVLEEIKNEIRLQLDLEVASQLTEVNTQEVEVVHDEVPQSIGTNSTANNHTVENMNGNAIGENVSEPTTPFTEESDMLEEIRSTFQSCLNEYQEMNPIQRPKIPKPWMSYKLHRIIYLINTVILPSCLNSVNSFMDLHNLIYCASIATCKLVGCKLGNTSQSTENPSNKKQKWLQRIERRISLLRQKIGRLQQYVLGTRTRNLENAVNNILQNFRIHSQHEPLNDSPVLVLDTLKQKLSVLTNRRKRYLECTLRKRQNYQFENNERQFYRNLTSPINSSNNNLPNSEQVTQFWSNIWSNCVEHNQNPIWLHEIENCVNQEMSPSIISIELLKSVIKKSHNWKSPGTDGIQNYWYKQFTCTHEIMTEYFNDFITNPGNIPTFMLEGLTYLLPKDDDTTNPAKYRPITCLQTIYKLLTSCISNLIMDYLTSNNILSEQQKGCAPGSKGCKEQLIIDSIIHEQRKKSNRNLYTMYIDYKKAFDSVPHTWLIKILEIYKIDVNIINLLKHIMPLWNTRLQIKNNQGIILTDQIQIRRGIFQGDSLSPLWFCLALNPLSKILNDSGFGFKINGSQNSSIKINHLMYMDDIKLYASSKKHLQKLFELVQMFTNDIKMEFGIDKCKTQSLSKTSELVGFELDEGIIGPLQDHELYKYLGFKQSKSIAHSEIKEDLKSKFKYRLKLICQTHLNSKNLVKSINTFAIPILTYSFGIIKWSKTDIEELNRIVRTTLTRFCKHHPKTAIQRTTLPRINGGRGFIDIKNLWYKQISHLRNYFVQNSENSPLHRILVEADQKLTPLNMNDSTLNIDNLIVDNSEKISQWSSKALHGRHLEDLNLPENDLIASNTWLCKGELFPETEGFIIAIQDQVIKTRNYAKHILHENIATDLCRKCNRSSETIQHIISGCPMLCQSDYLHRHNNVAKAIHQELALKYELISQFTPYYKYVPDVVMENANFKLYFDRTIYTDRTIPHNRPDITLILKRERIGFFIDVAIPNNNNLQTTYNEKMRKYSDLRIEMKRIWNLSEIKIVPVVLSSTGIIPKILHSSLKTLNIHSKFYVLLQKIVILDTCRIVRKFLDNGN